MNPYITGSLIKQLRESKKMTQQQLAEKNNVSAKAVSKWETNRGYPDVSIIEVLADALGVSVIELFSGVNVVNTNKSSNMRKMKHYVCPLCGNLIQTTGEAVVSCCGIVLPALEAEANDDAHRLNVERVEDEYYVSIPHEMRRNHFISIIMAVKDDGFELKKTYPEGSADARFKICGTRYFLYYCNQHGLFKHALQ